MCDDLNRRQFQCDRACHPNELSALVAAAIRTDLSVSGLGWQTTVKSSPRPLLGNGPLPDWTIGDLLREVPEQLLRSQARQSCSFPLLLKFLDARDRLSIQVQPSDQQADYLPVGESGKTKAWVVLEAGINSRVYSGLRLDTTADNLRVTVTTATVVDHPISFTPKEGQAEGTPGCENDLYVATSSRCGDSAENRPSLSAQRRQRGYLCPSSAKVSSSTTVTAIPS